MGTSTGSTKSVIIRNKEHAFKKPRNKGQRKGERRDSPSSSATKQSAAQSTTEVASSLPTSSSVKNRKRTPGCKKCEKDEEGKSWNKGHADHCPYSNKNKPKKVPKKKAFSDADGITIIECRNRIYEVDESKLEQSKKGWAKIEIMKPQQRQTQTQPTSQQPLSPQQPPHQQLDVRRRENKTQYINLVEQIQRKGRWPNREKIVYDRFEGCL